MKTSDRANPLYRRLVLVGQVLAVLVGLKYGFEFGNRISGTVLGIVVAINAAVFCSIVVGVIADRAFRQKATDRSEPQAGP
jgi:hypothetical protein